MGAWEPNGPAVGSGRSWRDIDPELAAAVERIRAPLGRGIAWEGSAIWAYRDRPANLVEVFERNVATWPEREAYVFHPGGQRLTWREAGVRVGCVAARLAREHGIGKRDRVCLLTLGCPDYVIGYLAVVRLGAIAVPVNLGLAPEGVAGQIDKVRAKALIVSPDIWHAKVAPIRDRLSSVETVFVTEGPEAGAAPPGTLAFAQLARPGSVAPPAVEIDEWDLCAISFTSGTTGAPKGTMAMHINALGCARNVVHAVKGLDEHDVNLCMPPLYHNTAVYADFLPALLTGGKCVVMSAFTPLEAIRAIERERATWAVAAPIMLWMMMNHPEFSRHDVSTLRKIVFGGHAASETFIRQLEAAFSPVAMVNAGSVSESTAMGFALPTEDALRKITSCGLATPNTEIAIFGDDGRALTEPELVGEVAYRGQQTNAGYWDEPAKTAEVFRRDGFVLSGDWAKLDREGYLWLLDRKKDMVVRGGQNVYCIEVENKLYLHPAVLRAAVVGVPDHVFSERVKAVLVLKPGQLLTAAEVREHCRQHLAPYEVPEYVVFAADLPTNAAGKTLKPALVDAWGESDRSAATRLRAFCDSVAPALMTLPHLKLDGVPITPREALDWLEHDDPRWARLSEVIDSGGIVACIRPDEARFRA